MRVFLSRKAAKALRETSSDVRRRLEEKISELSRTPYPAGCRKLRGAPNAYRVRVGDYRILYATLTKDEILVFKIARRETAYL
ncbi:MAG: type II toxin-antitoxin system RelE/ParE family toxin [Candidatus Bathyarchaeia archaeon]